MDRSSSRSPLCQSPEEELANSISHGVGTLLSIVALVVMVLAAVSHSPWHIAGVTIFGLSLILLYLASTIYHSVTSIKKKKLFQLVDHSFIFILIAGSYMPWLLVPLRGPWGWSILFAVWSLAIIGIVLKAVFLPRFDKLGTLLYLAMGWLIMIPIKPLLEETGWLEIYWLAAGGLCYCIGVIFYLMDNRRFAHLIWHLLVMAGSACHVVAVLIGVVPSSH